MSPRDAGPAGFHNRRFHSLTNLSCGIVVSQRHQAIRARRLRVCTLRKKATYTRSILPVLIAEPLDKI